MDRLILGSRVILCTLSMLSHPMLMRTGITRLVPLEVVLVDEASQIEIGDFLPMLSKFGSDIQKLAFIGDDKQRKLSCSLPRLPLSHNLLQLHPTAQKILKDSAAFLRWITFAKMPFSWESNVRSNSLDLADAPGLLMRTIIVRMPVPIGNFISRKVYSGRLKSEHTINDKSCCRFVDVPGKEIFRGGSYQVRTFVRLRCSIYAHNIACTELRRSRGGHTSCPQIPERKEIFPYHNAIRRSARPSGEDTQRSKLTMGEQMFLRRFIPR